MQISITEFIFMWIITIIGAVGILTAIICAIGAIIYMRRREKEADRLVTFLVKENDEARRMLLAEVESKLSNIQIKDIQIKE
jgi:ABC-type lipoprotein release transport system permease subunit